MRLAPQATRPTSGVLVRVRQHTLCSSRFSSRSPCGGRGEVCNISGGGSEGERSSTALTHVLWKPSGRPLISPAWISNPWHPLGAQVSPVCSQISSVIPRTPRLGSAAQLHQDSSVLFVKLFAGTKWWVWTLQPGPLQAAGISATAGKQTRKLHLTS